MAALPEFIGPYRVVRAIGAGGMGQIYECITPGGAKVAVKTVLEEYRSSQEVADRFRAEIEASKAMRGPYVADYFDSDLNALWLATRFYPWPSLREHIKIHGPLSIEKTASLALQVVEALHHMHSLGLVHRDVTPANILYKDGEVRLIDYGISKAMSVASGEGITGGKLPPHSWHYASPEHLAKKKLGSSSDYFSLGCVLVYAATGQVLLDDLRIVQQHIVPHPLRPLIYALIKDDPKARPGYYDVLLAAGSLMEPTGGNRSWLSPSLAASTSGPHHLEVFVTEQMPGRISHRWLQDGDWSDWDVMELPSTFRHLYIAQLATASRGTGNMELFASLEDGTILHRWYWSGHGWSDWAEFDRRGTTYRVTASSAGPDHLEVFAIDGSRIVHRWHTATGGWSEWRNMALPQGVGTVEAISAAGRVVGKQYLSATFADGSVALTIYSRAVDSWTEWIPLFYPGEKLGGATTWANEREAGVGCCWDNGREIWFTEQYHEHQERRSFTEYDESVAYPFPDPWKLQKVIAWSSASDRPGSGVYFALFEDGSIINLWARQSETRVLRAPTEATARADSGVTEATELLPPPRRTTPFPKVNEPR